jgi:hypothetical protein
MITTHTEQTNYNATRNKNKSNKHNAVAKEVNAQFYKNESHYVTVKERLEESLKTNWDKERCKFAVSNFKSRHPDIVNWNDIDLCESRSAKLSDILIDTTLQRLLNVKHFTDILSNFDQIRVMPIQVYVSKDKPNCFICWDGQHTVVTLYAVAVLALDLNPEDIEIPVVVYKSSLKSEMRSNFIKLNGDSKLPIDAIDEYQQTIFGVRTDNAKYPGWILNEKKQTYLEKADMFATNEKFDNADQPGALSNLSEFLDNSFDLDITEAFCKYFKAVCNSKRPVGSKETWMLYMYFNLCKRQKIALTDEYIQEVADSLNVAFEGEFDSEKLYDAAKLSWQNFYRNKISTDGTIRGISYDKKKDTLTFLIPQIKKYIKSGIVPDTFARYNKWPVAQDDLF